MIRRHASFALLVATAACASMSDDFDRQLLRPPGSWLAEPADLGLGAEPFEIRLHADASLTGYWIPNEHAAGRTVVLLHDETSNVSVQHPYYTFLHAAGFHVLTFDPRGFGRSAGRPTLRAWLHDLDAVFDWLHARPDVDPDRIALFGTSLGAIAAMHAARPDDRCCALVFEHLPSLRDMLRATVADPDSALGAYSVGILEFAGLPENIEPVDNAPHVETRALFIATENELPRNRTALLRAYDAFAGDKQLWVLPGTGEAPHAFLTFDGEYQRGIATFLDDAFAGRPVPPPPTANRVGDASDGEAWYSIEVADVNSNDEPELVEACAVLADGSVRYAGTRLQGGRGSVRIKLPATPTQVGARCVPASEPASGWPDRTGTRLSRSGATIAPLWPRIEIARNDRASTEDLRELATALEQAAATEPFDPRLEAELADVFARIGLALDDRRWLERAVAAVPEHQQLHFWPGPVATYGYPQLEMVERARVALDGAPR
ncbi:MAG: alpha/beta hydrolase [Planctomycetes bacterium]|nr:alpha/beta hydrolase [Planctomycetota bacterium]